MAHDDELSFRLAHENEWDAVGNLTQAAYLHDYTDLPQEYRDELATPGRLIPDYELWVAEQGSELVGTVAVLRPGLGEPGETYFRLLAVSPTARRRGVGTALTTFVVELARARRSSRVVLNSGPQMLGAHALYSATGFERSPEREYDITVGGVVIHLLTFTLELEERPVPSAT